MALTITKVDLTGSEVEYAIPAGTRRIFFQAPANDVTIATSTGGSVWTITATEIYLNGGFNVNNGTQTLFVTGTNGQDLIVLLES